MANRVRTVRTESEWRVIFAKFESSGLSRKEFLEREDISRTVFDKWYKLTGAAKGTEGEPAQFIHLKPSEPPPIQSKISRPAPPDASYTVELVMPSGTIISIRD